MGNIQSIQSSSGGKYRIDSTLCLLDGCKLKSKLLVGHMNSLVDSYPLTQNLTITSCKLKQVPLNVTSLLNLNELTLSDNKLSQLPWSLPPPILKPGNSMGTNFMQSIASVVNENLVKLDLSGNQFTEFPSCVFVLPNLTILIMDNNQISSISITMCGGQSVNNGNNQPYIACKLEELRMANNNFNAFPSVITDLSTLKHLDLSGNSLSSIPNSFSTLVSLTTLNLKSNKFTSFPASICTLDKLTLLNLSCNQITINQTNTLGISLLPSLDRLELQHNKFGQFPLDVLNLTSLKVLKLQDNDIEEIPDKIGNLQHLTELFLSENKITRLPSAIGSCVQLKKLYLEYNKIIGLPNEFSKLVKLNILILHNNELKVVPEELHQLTQLLRLSLDDNNLSLSDQKLIKSQGALALIKRKNSFGTINGSTNSSSYNTGSINKSSTIEQNLNGAGTGSNGSIGNIASGIGGNGKSSRKKLNHLTISRSLFRGNSSNLESEKDDFINKKQHMVQQQLQQLQLQLQGLGDDGSLSSTSSPITSHITVNSTVLDFEDDIQKMTSGDSNGNISNNSSNGSLSENGVIGTDGVIVKQRRGSVFLPPTNSFKLSPTVVSSSYNTLPASLSNLVQQHQQQQGSYSGSGDTTGGTNSPILNINGSTPSLRALSHTSSINSPSMLSQSTSVLNLPPLQQSSSSFLPPNQHSYLSHSTPNQSTSSSNTNSSNNTTLTDLNSVIPSFSKFKHTFDHLLEEQDFSKKKRETLNKLSKEQKWNLLLQYRNSTLNMLNLNRDNLKQQDQPSQISSSSSSSFNGNGSNGSIKSSSSGQSTPNNLSSSGGIPESTSISSFNGYLSNVSKNTNFQSAKFYCDNLSIKTDISMVKEVLEFLKEGGPEVSLFIGIGGIELVLSILQYNLDNTATQFDEEKVGYCLLCMKTLIECTAKSVITTHNSINTISMFLNSNSKYIVDIIIDIYDELLRLTSIGSSVVLDSLVNFQKVKGLSSPYVPLVAILRNVNIELSTKTTVFKILNFLVYSFNVLEERFSVICSLLKVGILEVISLFRSTSKNEVLRFELDLFEEVLDSDESELVKKIGRKEVLKRMSNEDSDLSKQSKQSLDFVRVVMVSAGYGDLKIDLEEKTSYTDVITFIQSNYQIRYDISRYGLFVPAIGSMVDGILQTSGQQSRWVDPEKSLIENGLQNEIVEFKMKPIQVQVTTSGGNGSSEIKSFTIDPQLKCFEIVQYIRTRLEPCSPAFQRKVSVLTEDEDEDYESDIYGAYCFSDKDNYNQGTWYPLNSRFLDFNPTNDPMIIDIKLMERPLRISFSGTEKLMKFNPYVPVSSIINEIKNEIHLKINIEDYGISYVPNVSQRSLTALLTDECWLDPTKTLLDHHDMKCTVVQFKFKPRSVSVTILVESGISTSIPNATTNHQFQNTNSISEIIEKICQPYELNPLSHSLYISDSNGQKIKLLSRQNCLRDQSVNNGDYLIITSKQKDLPSDFNVWDEPKDSPETITFAKDSRVSSITLNKIIEKLTSPEYTQDTEMKSIFISTYRSIITPSALLNKLIERHTIPTLADRDKGKLIQKKTRLLIKSWLELETPKNREEVIHLFADNMPNQSIEDDGQRELSELFIELTTKSYASVLPIIIGELPKSKIPKITNTHSLLDLSDMDEVEIARQLSLLLFPLYSKIETSELLNQKWSKPNGGPNIMAVVGLFNRISNWVSYTIVNQPKLKDRALVYGKMVKIANAFYELKNFHLLMAVISGLNSSPILRLKFTKAKLSKNIRDNLDHLEEVMSTQSSMKIYRAELAAASPPAIPFMGFHLSDLVFIDEGNQQLCDSRINFKKLEMYKKTITTLQNFSLFPYQFNAVPLIQNYFLEYTIVPEKPIYEMSLKAEPRNADRQDID